MISTGTLFMSKTAPLATHASDGTFALTLLAFDRIGVHQVEPYRFTYSGPQALDFYQRHSRSLTAGQPLTVSLRGMRTFSNGRNGTCETVCSATSIQLAPFSHEIGREPLSAMRGQLSKQY